MIDQIGWLITDVTNFFTWIYTYLTTGIYTLLQWAMAKFIEASTKAYYDFVLWALPFAWGVAKQIIIDLNLSALVNSAWSSLNSNILGIATLLRIPDSVNLFISAYFTKFVLRFIPFI